MSRNGLTERETPVAAAPLDLDPGRDPQSKEILRVLDKAAGDDEFIAQLTHRGSDALEGYELTVEAQAALLSGDVRWTEAHVGKLDARLRTWLDCRLQQEIW